MAVLALHVHIEMDFVLADLGHACVAPQAVLAFRLHLACRMRFVAFIAVELHGCLIIKSNLLGFFNRSRVRCKEPDIHRSIFSQLFADAFVVTVAIEALLPSRFEVPGPVGMAVKAGKAAHAFTVNRFSRMAFLTELFRGQEAVEPGLIGLHLSVALGALDLFHIHVLGMEKRFIDRIALSPTVWH